MERRSSVVAALVLLAAGCTAPAVPSSTASPVTPVPSSAAAPVTRVPTGTAAPITPVPASSARAVTSAGVSAADFRAAVDHIIAAAQTSQFHVLSASVTPRGEVMVAATIGQTMWTDVAGAVTSRAVDEPTQGGVFDAAALDLRGTQEADRAMVEATGDPMAQAAVYMRDEGADSVTIRRAPYRVSGKNVELMPDLTPIHWDMRTVEGLRRVFAELARRCPGPATAVFQQFDEVSCDNAKTSWAFHEYGLPRQVPVQGLGPGPIELATVDVEAHLAAVHRGLAQKPAGTTVWVSGPVVLSSGRPASLVMFGKLLDEGRLRCTYGEDHCEPF